MHSRNKEKGTQMIIAQIENRFIDILSKSLTKVNVHLYAEMKAAVEIQKSINSFVFIEKCDMNFSLYRAHIQLNRLRLQCSVS
jgi:hypothetical protein